MLDGQIHDRALTSLQAAAFGGMFAGFASAQGPMLSFWTVVAVLVMLLTAVISLEIHPSAEEVAITWREQQALDEEEEVA